MACNYHRRSRLLSLCLSITMVAIIASQSASAAAPLGNKYLYITDSDRNFEQTLTGVPWGTGVYCEVNGVSQYTTTKWYVNNVLKETDESGFFAIDPQYFREMRDAHGTNVDIDARLTRNGTTRIRRFTITVTRSDLVTRELYVTNLLGQVVTSLDPSQPMTIHATVKNTDGAEAPQSEVRFTYESMYVGGAIGTGLVPNTGTLDSGEERSEIIAFTAPGDPGFLWLTATADYNNAVGEQSEFNNARTIRLTIEGNVTVPDFVGILVAPGDEDRVEFFGLLPGVITREYNDVPADTVLSQSLTPGVSVRVGTHIDLVISKGPMPTIQVQRPQNGDSWELDRKHKIKWTTSAKLGGDVRIQLWQNGSRVANIKKATPNDGVLNWRIKSGKFSPGTGYNVRVISLDDTQIKGSSDGTFSITAP